MKTDFNYKAMFDQALSRIKSVRDPRATKPERSDLRWNEVEHEVMFDFGGHDLARYNNVAKAAQDISISILKFIILKLLELHDYDVEEVQFSNEEKIFNTLRFAVLEKKSKTLILFKELEECPFWSMPGRCPESIENLMRENGASGFRVVYFVFDKAYLQVIGHNDDENDPGRGYPFYSIKWFFETYFSEKEYKSFETAVREYISEVNSCMGFSIIKPLTPYANINFRKITENELLTFHYEKMINIPMEQYSLEEEEYEKIRKQYIDDKKYLLLLGDSDFAESLATAEWLYDSMKRAQAIDLTAIGMGYFKAVEQLLYELICLHKNEGRLIKKIWNRDDLPSNIEVCDNISRKRQWIPQ